ncbi:galanin receptor type 1 [Erinaceus europaeus]|uniref:Galanin receptor type 1 n=1 Tax=Erinaceus europaeus TaxID=9365 RepID=A0A1S3AKF0_ERIEU|nr:galanin receptor type 1 [Erinaceus europaeus]
MELNLSEANSSVPWDLEPQPAWSLGPENLVALAAFGLIFTLGVLGNALVIVVLSRRRPGRPRGPTELFVLNLSVADLAYLLCCVPFQAVVYARPTWELGAFACKASHYVFTVSMLVSVFTLAAMAVDRYVAVVLARRAPGLRVARNALRGLGCIWALSLGMAAPVAAHQRLLHHQPGNLTFCWEQWPDPRHKKAYVLCTFLLGYLLPLTLICFCYAKVLTHLHSNLKNMSKKSEASKKKTTQTVLVVVVVFGVSWLPHHVVHLWAEFGAFPLTPASFLLRVAAHCLAYSNSSVNPIIYAFLSENFRKAYRQVCSCPPHPRSPALDAKEAKSRLGTPPSTNCSHV